MGMIALGGRLRRPISAPMLLDRTHPLARGLLGAWGLGHYGRGKVFDYVKDRNVPVANTNNTTAVRYADGYRFRRNATQAMADQDVATITTITRTNLSFSMVQHISLHDTGNAYRAYGSIGAIGDPTYITYNTGGSGGQCQLWFGHAGGTTTGSATVNTRGVGRSTVVGVSHRFGVGAGGVRAFVDGKYITNGSGHTGSATYNFNRLAFGGLTYNGGNVSGRESNNGVALFLLWDRALGDGDMASITANPYQILVPAVRQFFTPGGITIFDVNGDNRVYHGGPYTVNCLGAGAAQGTVYINGVSQSISSWNDTTITGTVNMTDEGFYDMVVTKA